MKTISVRQRRYSFLLSRRPKHKLWLPTDFTTSVYVYRGPYYYNGDFAQWAWNKLIVPSFRTLTSILNERTMFKTRGCILNSPRASGASIA